MLQPTQCVLFQVFGQLGSRCHTRVGTTLTALSAVMIPLCKRSRDFRCFVGGPVCVHKAPYHIDNSPCFRNESCHCDRQTDISHLLLTTTTVALQSTTRSWCPCKRQPLLLSLRCFAFVCITLDYEIGCMQTMFSAEAFIKVGSQRRLSCTCVHGTEL